METTFEDKQLGKIVVRTNMRARNIILRGRPDAIYVTVPNGISRQEIQNALDKFRDQLTKQKKKTEKKQINIDFKINAPLFRLQLIQQAGRGFLSHSELGRTTIICPPTTNFEDEKLQKWLRKVIEEALRRNAKIILPQRLIHLSQKLRLPFADVKINSSQGRWGSCSAQKNINLSFYLMLLPEHLIDYVILHELCHTQEMNHGDRFWKLLNSFTDGKALELRSELRTFQTEL